MLLSEIASVISGNVIHLHEDLDVKSLVYDSRKATNAPNQLFIALQGEHHDGHDFIPTLVEKGLKSFLVSRDIDLPAHSLNIIQVPDVLTALQQLVAYHRDNFDIPIVGITGSNGKTIVKEWLSGILSNQWQVVKSPKSFNSQLGVPLSVWEMNK
ncbi:MAG: Mur ligase domain-containing protein, partial [Marinoscillum sp.]